LLDVAEILRDGLTDLQAGRRTIPALLVLAARPRLTWCGVTVPLPHPPIPMPEHDLYRLLCSEYGDEAYRHYRSLMRRLVSLEQALEAVA
jgi:hypothetical protein